MNAADHVGELTGMLARIGARAQPVEPSRTGVDAALHGRGAVLALSQQILDDLVRSHRVRHPTLEDLENRPMAVLAWAVGHHPRLSGSQSPIDVSRTVAPRSTASLWEHAGAIATKAHVHWALRESTPSGTARRAAVADIAVVALALTRLEDALATSAGHLGDPVVTERLATRHASGLRLAAELTLRQAAAQDLPTWEAHPRPDVRRLNVQVVRDVSALPHGLHRLNQLLRVGSPLSPGNIATLLTAQMRMSALLSQRAAKTARQTGDDSLRGLAARLATHSRTFTGTWESSDNLLASLQPSDPRAVQQAGECLRALRSAGGGPTPGQSLRQSATLLIDAACATSACVQDQVRAGNWISSHAGVDNQQVGRRWQRVSPGLPPNVMSALTKLESAIRASKLLETPTAGQQRPLTSSEVLQSRFQPTRRTSAPPQIQRLHR